MEEEQKLIIVKLLLKQIDKDKLLIKKDNDININLINNIIK